MKRVRGNKVPNQVSKISDFFGKTPNIQTQDGPSDNKRKLIETLQSTENKMNILTSHQEKLISPTYKKLKTDENFPLSIKSEPPDLSEATSCSAVNIFKIKTPEKCVKPSSIIKTPTPKKNLGDGGSSSKVKTPHSGKKGTPRKLFEKSPRKLEEFNVQVLEAFVKISPSTSNRKITVGGTLDENNRITPIKLYVLPASASSNRSSPAQSRNETTPSKSPKPPSFCSPKVKTKLSFLESVESTNKKEKMENEKCNADDGIDGVKDEFGSFFEDDFDILLSFEEELNNLNLNDPQHCKILKVTPSKTGIVLKLKSLKDCTSGLCSIEEFWASGNQYSVGDTIHIKAENINGEWVVNNEKGFLIYEPDLLIPCTSVVGSIFCKRKSVLADRFRGFDSSNCVMIIGILAHTLLQQSLKNKLRTSDEIESLLKSILDSKDTIKRLYESSLTREDLESELRTFIPKLISFIDDYLKCDDVHRSNSGDWQGKIYGIDDIEENLWCPELGIKGKIDVTLQTNSGVTPLELKTGRASVSLEHRGQVVLYIMMMNKFGYGVSSGLLLYLREGVLKEIKASPQEKRDMIILRNELAYFLTRNAVNRKSNDVLKPPEMPEPLNNPRTCPKCPYNVICTSFLNYEDHDISKNKTIQDVQKTATAHLTSSHLDYFLHWSNLLNVEENSNKMSKSISQIYTVPPKQREVLGRCIISVKVTNVNDGQNGLYEHVFEKENAKDNLTAYDIVENNYVVVSTDSRPAVATGFVTDISATKISILLDRNLGKKYPHHLFHIDTYDSNITYTFNMTSLALLLENSPRAAELRNIIIDKKTPTFQPKLPSVVAKKGAGILKRLNVVQQKAVLKALCAKDFFLIKGMPGTGKSATIVALIQLLLALDKSVLITSHTHSAIDNICTRLQKRGVDFLRLGSESKIDANLKSNSEATLLQHCTTPQEMEETYNKYQVIAVTCLGSGHPLLSKRTVDVCIVDESTQVLQTSILRPLYAAKTFVLIGDPDQLAPLVRNRDALKSGMSESLFERLENSEGTIALNLNYRMNQTITDLANILTYKGQLKPASDDIAIRTLDYLNTELIERTYKDHCWLLKAMDTSLKAAVQLIDTGPVWQLPQDVRKQLNILETTESFESQNYLNVYEIAIVVALVKALIKGGVESTDIGVIATYRAQVNQISDLLETTRVDVSTVDQYQGRDKTVIIYSCTKSTDPMKTSSDINKSELLEDKRRLTVAITRAKRKLIIVGDVSTLQRFNTFATILPSLKNNIIKFDSPWTQMGEF